MHNCCSTAAATTATAAVPASAAPATTATTATAPAPMLRPRSLQRYSCKEHTYERSGCHH
jgi:hypothetical protein